MKETGRQAIDWINFRGLDWLLVILGVQAILVVFWFFTVFVSIFIARQILLLPHQHPYLYAELTCAFMISPPVAWLLTLLLVSPIKRKNRTWGQAYQVMALIHGAVLFGALAICFLRG